MFNNMKSNDKHAVPYIFAIQLTNQTKIWDLYGVFRLPTKSEV